MGTPGQSLMADALPPAGTYSAANGPSTRGWWHLIAGDGPNIRWFVWSSRGSQEARAPGFSDQSHLNCVMRAQRGVSPGQLRDPLT